MSLVKLQTRRSFGGKLENFKDKAEKRFEQAHLKAYLKGRKTFNHGFGGSWPNLFPLNHNVKEIWS